MNILLDTNILIPLEDTGRELDPRLAALRRGTDENSFFLYIHPAQLDDINNDTNESRRIILLSRIQQYRLISNPPSISKAERDQYGWNETRDNDRIDNLLLHALNRGAIDILVTNDEGIHRKAVRIGIEARVYRLNQIINFFEAQYQQQFTVPYGIRERYLYEFDVNQPFFDSLRQGYGREQFNHWYNNASRQHRKCWCIVDENTTAIKAICIYKIENSSIVTDSGDKLRGKILKLCTLKVGEAIRGRKIGERLLYTSFKYAVDNQIDHIYIQINTNLHDYLVSLVQDYGFQYYGPYSGDDVYSKPMTLTTEELYESPIEYAKRYYPHFKDDLSIAKFIVPIKPEFHEELFPDISNFSHSLFSDDPSFFSPQSNTIKKAYLCHASTNEISIGDIVLFYRTHDRRKIEVIGVVEQALKTQNQNLALSLVSKRTVYSPEYINRLLERPTLIILFRLMKYIRPISHNLLVDAGIHGPIQTVRCINHQSYLTLLAGT